MGIYLDNSATSFPKPESVYTSIDSFLRQNGTSAGRGNYALAHESEALIYGARKAIAELLGAKRPGNIVFTSNVTESLNLALKGFLNNGDAVLTSNIEHNAMWRPLKSLEQEKGIRIDTFNCSADGQVDLDEVKKKINKDTKLVATIHGSNVLGNILPLAEIIKIAHEKDIPVLVDAAQTAGSYPLSIEALDVDFLAFTGHKGLLATTGTGGIYIRDGLQLKTFKEGGTGSISKSPFQPDTLPDRFEAGTMNTMGLVGLKAAAEFILETGVTNIYEHENMLISYVLDGLASIDEVEVFGSKTAENRLGLVSFNIKGSNPYDVALWLDEQAGIMVRAGLHCSPQAHRLLGTLETGAIRASVGYSNTLNDIKLLLEFINKYITMERR